MVRKAMTPEPLDRALARVFSGEAKRHEYTYDYLAGMSGVSRTRVHRLLTAQAPFYLSDVEALAAVLGIPMSTAIHRAEEHVRLAEEMGGEL